VSRFVLLDAGPLGLVTNPQATPQNREAAQWLDDLPLRGFLTVVPEIADYEVRRELLRAGKVAGLNRLDALKQGVDYLPITTDAMLLAAEFWARARRLGRQSTNDASLDADVILAAQAALLAVQANQVLIATTNVRHLALFVDARHWRDIG
jgi:predicted nucleic acid-binding protein